MLLGLYFHFFCDFVGTDEFGNTYYLAKWSRRYGRLRRFVSYHGNIKDANRMSIAWHPWMHYYSDEIPDTKSDLKRKVPHVRDTHINALVQNYVPWKGSVNKLSNQ